MNYEWDLLAMEGWDSRSNFGNLSFRVCSGFVFKANNNLFLAQRIIPEQVLQLLILWFHIEIIHLAENSLNRFTK